MSRKSFFLLLVFSIMAVSPVSAAEKFQVPEPLKPWVDWVLHDYQEELLCSANYDNPGKIRCDWPTSLDLEISADRGSFRQSAHLQYESWIQLPGSERIWPEKVTVNNEPALILMRQGFPHLRLGAGDYRINSSFSWKSMPEFLRINPDTGLITLRINNKPIEFPRVDPEGRVWLHAGKQAGKVIEDSLRIRAFRMIDDRIPARIELELNLDVAGSPREVLLGAPFSPDKFIPLSLSSSLPARLEKDGRLRLQLRPGQWHLSLTARHIGPLDKLQFVRPDDEHWPDREIWVFAKQDNRIVEIEGVPPIDPQQTTLPPKWRNLPAYQLTAGNAMQFKMIQRGNPDPAPDQLSLRRALWLRFDGSGFTIQDRISGQKTSDWRLEMAPSLNLGRVAIDGEDQFITRMEGSDKTGIELRNGVVEITADSEYRGGIGRIPAVGWDQDFRKVDARLFLPPGYRLIHATGIDNIPATWLNRWTLLDIFILLIFTIALAKLYSRPVAVLGFITLALLFHEPGAPRWIWLALLIGVALVRTVPEGRIRQAVKIYHALAFLLLVIIAIPFSVQHLRVGIFPQLEKPEIAMGEFQAHQIPAGAGQKQLEPEAGIVMHSAESLADLEERGVARLKGIYATDVAPGAPVDKQVAQRDPAMINQTGPGIPAWRWNTVHMSWSGPVKRGQEIGLLMLGPGTSMFLAFLRIGLMIALALTLLGVSYNRPGGWRFPDRKAFLLIPLLFLPLLLPAGGRAAEIPSPALFEELRERLLEKEECFPNCADIPAMAIEITPDRLDLELSVAAAAKVAIPLPGHPQHWLARSVSIDKVPATAIYATGQSLWLMVPAGRHTVRLSGPIPPGDNLQLPLPLKPHRLRVEQSGWTTEGVHRDGAIDNRLHFRRIVRQGEEAGSHVLESGILPPFVRIERDLRLGLDWRIETTVTRISPLGSGVVVEYPLLPGEAVVSGNLKVRGGKARINLDPQDSYLKFHSLIDKNEKLLLRHARTDDWTETWQVYASPIFHLEYEGLPVILHQVGSKWAPKWHPWPGEELTLMIGRPQGVSGQTVTIDKSRLEVNPGQRATDVKLELNLRGSQGGQHTITLPPDSQLREVRIDNRVQTIRQEGRLVTVPIRPGEQEIHLDWRRENGLTAAYKTPEIDLGLASANTNIDLKVPTNRWPLLLSGPAMGPAILFWAVLLVIVLTAYGLHKSGLTPLGFGQWLLLGIGLGQSNLVGGLLVVGWLIALHFRGKLKPDLDRGTFNLLQVCLGALTGLAILALLVAISRGLLGHPDMNIIGNGSTSELLRWYQDYSGNTLPRAWLLSVPLFWYRLAMLAWALWISFTLIKILRHGWQAFSKPVIWYPTGKGKTTSQVMRNDLEESGREEEIDLTDELQTAEEEDGGKK
ncbi:MAG: hypothetical protein ABR523_05515 [Desulfurivibrionaceae bacterium]